MHPRQCRGRDVVTAAAGVRAHHAGDDPRARRAARHRRCRPADLVEHRRSRRRARRRHRALPARHGETACFGIEQVQRSGSETPPGPSRRSRRLDGERDRGHPSGATKRSSMPPCASSRTPATAGSSPGSWPSCGRTALSSCGSSPNTPTSGTTRMTSSSPPTGHDHRPPGGPARDAAAVHAWARRVVRRLRRCAAACVLGGASHHVRVGQSDDVDDRAADLPLSSPYVGPWAGEVLDMRYSRF